MAAGPAFDLRWNDVVLDAARQRGDAVTDAVIADVATAGGLASVGAVMAHLVTNDQLVPDRLPAPVRDYLSGLDSRDSRDLATVAAGERVFATHGPEILLLLCCSSLPSSYAAAKGVQVLHRTAYLAKRPTRRLFETAQMVIDVMSPGGLGAAGRGLRTVQKVRLMHAAIRHLLVHDARTPWAIDALGRPINQEDLLGTLMTFSWLIVDGLSRLGVPLGGADRDAYTAAWMHIGRLMGIEPDLLPATVEETASLTALIERRQVAPSPEGREMTAALLEMMRRNLPAALSGVPASLIREFLPASVADGLGVPAHPLEQTLLTATDLLVRPFERLVDRQAGRHVALRVLAVRLLQGMQAVELGDARARFAVPATLADGWSTAPADSEASFWRKLVAWDAGRH